MKGIRKRTETGGQKAMPLPKHCKGCFYRRSLGADSGEKFCAYILIEGHSRGCSVEVCDKKKKAGRRKKKRWEDFY